MKENEKKDMRNTVRKSYGKIATDHTDEKSCCGGGTQKTEDVAGSIGYSALELKNNPKEANMGLGCGNPLEIGEIKEGETVIDLGSGAGMDSFLAAKKVGDKGFVIGVDMTPEMVSKARSLTKKYDYQNVDFRLGEIENLPIGDGVGDVIISNCVINLSSEKQRVYHEAFRVLKKGGRMAISDIVLIKEPTEAMKADERLYCGWVTGASSVEELEILLSNAGFKDIAIKTSPVSKEYADQWELNLEVGSYIMAAAIQAVKK